MINISNYIVEKLIINKDTAPIPVYTKLTKDSKREDFKKVLDELNELANDKDLRITLRLTPNNTGDFTFFVYDKLKPKSRYLVGYDGDWDSIGPSFQRCYELTQNFIEHFKR